MNLQNIGGTAIVGVEVGESGRKEQETSGGIESGHYLGLHMLRFHGELYATLCMSYSGSVNEKNSVLPRRINPC